MRGRLEREPLRSPVRESELLSHIYRRSRGLSADFGHVIVGPGDDCAVVATASGDQLLLKVDQLVAGRHFRPFPETPIDLIARKAMARAISDVAAMGGTPSCALAAATLPGGFERADELFDAMARWAMHWGCPLIGGDIATQSDEATERRSDEEDNRRHRGCLVLGVTVVGSPHAGRGPVLRSGAVPGDAVYVTGSLGGSLDAATGSGRHLTFEPRLVEAKWLCDTLGGRLHAMMDLSDGLGRDAARLGEASKVAMEVESGLLPLGPGVRDWRAAVGDGEDYELLFATPGNVVVPEQCPETGTRVTRIGRVVSGETGGPRCVIVTPEGPIAGDELGWDHGAAGAKGE